MGTYLEPEDAKRLTQVDRVTLLDVDVLDEMYIVPAENVMKQAFRLEVNTEGEPWRWSDEFDDRADLRTEYWADCKRVTMMIVDRMAVNPHGVSAQSSAGISVSYGPMVPDQARAIMKKWGRTPQVFRS